MRAAGERFEKKETGGGTKGFGDAREAVAQPGRRVVGCFQHIVSAGGIGLGSAVSAQNAVKGDLIEFNGDGAWCWYQDERVIVDAENGKMLIGTAGKSQEGRVDVVMWDLATGSGQKNQIGSMSDTDDHGALDPDNPHIVYISTPYNPRTDEGDFNGKKEIWKGITCDDGATFHWEPITAGSNVDNLRPMVPEWDSEHTALLWMRGTYRSAQDFTMKIVGLIEGPWSD